ncbi:MAG TPA: 4-alpha-glucanotransferase [Rubrobacteraceae bacterium]|nr:4-alpha-glucanotransferase [Rubrobacteraceae bacterium]
MTDSTETENIETRRSAGILLHPTSLPGPYGIGELGPEALEFIRFLEGAGQKLWQILPLNPTGEDGSPYSSYSAFAGNPLLISTEKLVEDGLLGSDVPEAPHGPVDYPAVISAKTKLLREASGRIKPGKDFRRFQEEHETWLDDYALYMALKGRYGGRPWHRWDEDVSKWRPRALKEARRELEEEIRFHEICQYLFFRHWEDVKSAANAAGVEVIGDIPIFVSHDSADVWANQELFFLDSSREPTVVAGVPPDYFSETGQLWGNPLYDWEALREDGYSWWVARLRMALTLYDAVRVDHFRGFEAYWEIPAGEETARNGRWVKGPGEKVFRAFEKALGELPIIAEDLGEITPEVEALRDELGLPGMKVLQFAFSGPDNAFLPHDYADDNWVVYTGTHDNDTTAGWWASADLEGRNFARRYLGKEFARVWDFIRLAHASVARRAIVPMQDTLELGSENRMNIPGAAEGNWTWRLEKSALTPQLAERLRNLTETYGR